MSNIRPNKTGVPLYIQLYEHLKKDVVNGIFPYGSRLPSKRTLAAEKRVSTITVKHAYELLCAVSKRVPRRYIGA